MNRADRISGAFWFLFSVFVTLESYHLGVGSLRRPGPGFFYFWLGILLAVLALIVLARAWSGKSEDGAQESLFAGRNILKIALVLASVYIYAIFLEWLGFVIVTLFLFLFLLGFMEKKKIVFTVLTSVAITAAAYILFQTLLHSQLPVGLLRF